MKKIHPSLLIFSLFLGLLATNAQAKLAKADRKAAKKLFSDKIYLKLDAPCTKGRHSWGVYYSPLVEVTPEGTSLDDGDGYSASFWHQGGTYWGIRVNDPVELDELEFDDDEVEIELEGVGPADDEETVILFKNIHSLDDFKAAFDHTFSNVPLQDLHEDWSSDIKQAIADRKLMDGMTKRQAYYVTGAPEKFEKNTVDGKEVEIWELRQTKGVRVGFFGVREGKKSGLLSSIRFEDGKLVDAGSAGNRDDFSLDD